MKKTVTLMVIGAAFLAIALNIKCAWSIICWLLAAASPVIAGLSIAFVLNVPLRFFENKVFGFMSKSKHTSVRAMKKLCSIVATLVIVIAALTLLVLIILPDIVDAIESLTAKLAHYDVSEISNSIENAMKRIGIPDKLIADFNVTRHDFTKNLIAFFRSTLLSIVNQAAELTTSIVSSIFTIILALVIALYTLVSKERLGRFCNRFLDNFISLHTAKRIRTVAKVANTAFSKFIIGQAFENVVLGVMCYAGMIIFGFPYAGVISVIVGVAQTIPVIGGIISATIGTLFMLTESPPTAIFFLILIVIIQQLEGNLIYPKVVGKQVGLPGLAVMATVTLGSNLFGILGVLVGIPLTATVYALIKLEMQRREEAKNTAIDSSAD